jgi:hypothetical protein
MSHGIKNVMSREHVSILADFLCISPSRRSTGALKKMSPDSKRYGDVGDALMSNPGVRQKMMPPPPIFPRVSSPADATMIRCGYSSGWSVIK